VSERVCPMSHPPLAYFLTFHTYGSWLHGHPEGSVDSDHNELGMPFLEANPRREQFERRTISDAPLELEAEHRYVVNAAIRAVCGFRSWVLHALHVRTTHVHAVLTATITPERTMGTLKAWSTRRLVDSGLIHRGRAVWSHHGSTRYINGGFALRRAIEYTLGEQGSPLPMLRPKGWRDEWNAPGSHF
jgi:hypothetical protein